MWRKSLRTAQNFFPVLQEAKNHFYYLSRRYARTVHDREFGVVRLLPRQPGDLFVDVGANRGQSIMAIRHYRPDARIVSFEPNPLVFERLRRRFGQTPGVSLRNLGLGSETAELTLYVPSYRGFVYDGIASFSHATAQGYLSAQTLFFFNPAHVRVAEHACHVRTLDSFGLAPSFIKLDIEGYEYDALRGGLDTLRRHEPVLLVEEFWGDPRVAELLGGLGYREVVERDGALVPGRSTGVSALYATPRRMPALR